MEQCIALTTYDAVLSDELGFKRGDIINVTSKGGQSGYWEGYVASPNIEPPTESLTTSEAPTAAAAASATTASRPPTGFFASCFVSSNLRPWQTAKAFTNKALSLYDYAATDASEMSFVKGDIITVVRPSASPGWWLGLRADDTEALHFPSSFVCCDIVQAAFAFHGRLPHELSCEVGDVLRVHRRWGDGWWEGSSGTRRGLFPSNYTVPNVPTSATPFFCMRCKSILESSKSIVQRCVRCAREEAVTDELIDRVDAYARGATATLDLLSDTAVEQAAHVKPSSQPLT